MRFYGRSYKTKQFFFALLKLSIVLLAFYSIWLKLMDGSIAPIKGLTTEILTSEGFSIGILCLIFGLSGLNWLFEILKWQALTKAVRPTSFGTVLKQSLGSLTASIMTPNRIGEYGAKAVCYQSSDRMKIVFLNFLGNAAQMVATTLFGCWALYHLRSKFDWAMPHLDTEYMVIIFSGLAVAIVLLLYGKNLKVKGYSVKRLMQFIERLPLQTLIFVQLYSLLRYVIFSFQMVVLFWFFGIDLNYLQLFPMICCMYLLASILPSLVIFDVIIKGGVAFYFFGYFGIPETTTLAVIMLMWLFNTVVPSIAGSYFVFNFKLEGRAA